jgi:hypothetical protein
MEESPEERIAKIERCQAKLAAAKAGLQARQSGMAPGAVPYVSFTPKISQLEFSKCKFFTSEVKLKLCSISILEKYRNFDHFLKWFLLFKITLFTTSTIPTC